MTDTLMNISEVAQYVRVSEFTVRRLAKEGILPAVKIGRAYRFKKEHIDEFLKAKYKTSQESS